MTQDNYNPVKVEATRSSGVEITMEFDEFDGEGNAVVRITAEQAQQLIRDLRSAALTVEFQQSLRIVAK